jgi:nucleoside-diphosphate kinase
MKVLLILKPDCIEKGLEAEVKKILESKGYAIVAERKIEKVSTDELEAHYNTLGKLRQRLTEAKGAEFAEKVINSTFEYMSRGPILPFVVEKDGDDEEVVSSLRNDVIGATRPWQAKEGTIREMYGNKDPEHEPIENVIHCSGNVEEAYAEVKLWFPELA